VNPTDPLFRSGYVGFGVFGRLTPDAPARQLRPLASRIGGRWSEQTPGGNPPSQSSRDRGWTSRTWITAKRRTAYAHLSPHTDTDTPLINSFSGIAQSRVSHLTKLSPPAVTGFSSRIATSQRERSTGDLAPLHRLAYEAADGGLLSPELSASTRRVKGVKELGGVGLETGSRLRRRRFWQVPDRTR
jgi:hypothetical protein